MIRPATPADAAPILAFWAPLVAQTTITFAPAAPDSAALAAQIAERQALGRGFFVAETAGEVQGFASYDQFRKGLGYVHSMEHTIILAPQARGRGLGRALMAALEAQAQAAGVHLLVAGISAENPPAIAFHSAIGFAPAGRVAQAGHKFGRFIDLVLMQKLL